VRIAVDLLGGDHAPAVVVDGAQQACSADSDLELVLVGPRPAADESTAVPGDGPGHDARISHLEAERGVDMAAPATDGADPRTSIGAAMRALAGRQVDAVVSAGSSGATVAAAVVAVGRLSGLRRPALAAILPTPAGPLVLLDVGAGLQVKPVDLVQHAALGTAYARLAAGIESPRIGLLSVGSEPGKGDKLRRAADATLRAVQWTDSAYVGSVEGHDVVTGGAANVIVTDGFTGNVLLKALEAAMAAMAAGPYPPAAVPRGATLLGVAGTVVVCHGAASGADVASGVALAARLVRSDVVGRLARRANAARARAWPAEVST
jgi:glycerol-3-phosphate acyltransferase PlsX